MNLEGQASIQTVIFCLQNYDLSKKTPLKTTKLLSEIWKLPEPELIISLHGTVCMDLIAGNQLNFYR